MYELHKCRHWVWFFLCWVPNTWHKAWLIVEDQ